MAENPQVILSGFADEAANQKTAEQQFAAFAAIGLQYYSLRFIDAGHGIKNVMKLTKGEIPKIRHLEDEYGLNVATHRLADRQGQAPRQGGRHQERFRAVQEVPGRRRAEGLRAGPRLRDQADPRLLVLSSARAPTPGSILPQVVDQLGQIAETCHRSDLTFGLEVEANLVGQNGELMAEIHKQVNHPGLGADLRRRQHHHAGLLTAARCSSSTRR